MATSVVPFDPKFVSLIRRVLSVAETGRVEWNPSSVEVFADDNRFTPPRKQVTLSVGFTEGGGNLKKVLKRYIDKGGASALTFAPYLATMGSGPTLANDPKFIKALKEAGKEAAMVEAQHECFEELYLEPAFAWAKRHGFTLPLSFMVIADSFLHSGSMLDFLMAKFPEKKPKDGGDERAWLQAYLKARQEWLAAHSNRVLRNTVYRVKCYRGEIARDNWILEISPIVMNGTPVAHLA